MKRPLRITIGLGVLAALVAVAIITLDDSSTVPDAGAQSLSNSTVELVRVFEDVSLQQPVWMTQAPDDPGRWYVVEQAGRLVTFTDNPKRRERSVALDITDRVEFGGEQGLLGLAFHPRYADNGYVYVNYVSEASGTKETRISRFRRDGATAFDPDSEKILLRVEQPYSNHNGGGILFGPDGYLYVGMGDGGLAGDPKGHGQNTETLLGAFLRIDVDSKDPYAIPADNPFASGKGGAPEVWAWGLRNPWRFSFDRKTGKLWAGDVGQNAWEEVSIIEGGENYGWKFVEGTHCYDPPLHLKVFGSGECDDVEGFASPEFDYSQANGDKSVTGGYVYRGRRIPSLRGKYVFGDFVSGRIWSWDPERRKRTLLFDTPLSIATFVESADGDLGVLNYSDGGIFHLTTRK